MEYVRTTRALRHSEPWAEHFNFYDNNTFGHHGSDLIACGWLTLYSIPSQGHITLGVNSISSASCTCYCWHWSEVNKWVFSLLPSQVSWFLMVGSEVGIKGQVAPPNPAVFFPKGEVMRSVPSWSDGNMLVPSESECREMHIIKAPRLQVRAC